MSEETGGIVAGRLNAVVINQSELNNAVRDALIYQIQTANNTAATVRELAETNRMLTEIKNRENNLLSQGIS